jgi:hypothetical protein
MDDLLNKLDTPPHFRLILSRLLHKVADYRYSSLSILRQDLQVVREYLNLVSEPEYQKSASHSKRLCLQHFLNFRLKVIARNPEHKRLSPTIRSNATIKRVSQALDFLDSDALVLWRTGVQRKPTKASFPSRSEAKTLSPEGRWLLGVAEGWEILRISPEVGAKDDVSPLTKLLLYRLLSIEASSCLYGIVASNEGLTEDNVASMQDLILSIKEATRDGSVALTLRCNEKNDNLSVSKVHWSTDDLQQIQHIVAWLAVGDDRPPKQEIHSLRVFGIFITLFACNCVFLIQDHPEVHSHGILSKPQNSVNTRDLWHLMKDLPLLDEEISHLEKVFTDETEMDQIYSRAATECWQRVPGILESINKLNPCKRSGAEIYSFDVDQCGVVRLLFPWSEDVNFSTSQVYLSGSPYKQEDKRPAKADALQPWKRKPKVSSILAPSANFAQLDLPNRRFSYAGLARWIRSRHHLQHVTFLLTVVLVVVFVAYSSLSIAHEIHGWGWWALLPIQILALLLNILTNLASDRISGWLATRYPEDARILAEEGKP